MSANNRADRPRARHQSRLAEQRSPSGGGVQTYRNRLGERGVAVRQRIGNGNGLFRLANKRFAKAAVDMRGPHRAAVEAHVRAMIAQTLSAIRAGPAREARIDGDALTGPQRTDVAAGLDHHAGDLMPENHGVTKPHRPKSAVAVIVKVRSADASDRDLHPHLACAKRLLRHLIVAQVPGGVDDDGFHGRRPDLFQKLRGVFVIRATFVLNISAAGGFGAGNVPRGGPERPWSPPNIPAATRPDGGRADATSGNLYDKSNQM